MKIITLSLLIALPVLASCQSAPKAEKDFSKLSWLEGTWVRTNTKPGRSGSEQWTKGKGNEWIGLGVAMKGADTTFVERVKLVVKGDEIYYVADVPENTKPVDFRITSIDEKSFVCENPAHDFPKKIAYYKDGNKLRAVISGDGKETEYLFLRK